MINTCYAKSCPLQNTNELWVQDYEVDDKNNIVTNNIPKLET